MENLDSDLPREGTFFGTEAIKGYLLETAKWAKFLSIIGFVVVGLMVCGAIFIMISGGSSDIFPGTPIPLGSLGLIYVVFAALYFFPIYYLYQFSTKVKDGLRSQSLESTTVGFQNLKSHYKFMGIFMIIVLSLYALIFIIAIAAGAMAGL